LHIRYHHIGQGEATSAVMPTVTRLTPPPSADGAARIATALGVWKDGMSAADATAVTAEALASFYQSIGMPTRLRELDVPETALPTLARDTRKNFNAYPGIRPDDNIREMLRLLQAAW
jgi:alcohol dehydrogenase